MRPMPVLNELEHVLNPLVEDGRTREDQSETDCRCERQKDDRTHCEDVDRERFTGREQYKG